MRDTTRGVVSVVGSEPQTQVTIVAPGGAMVALEGELTRTLRGMAGLDVMVSGRRTTRINAAASPRGAVVFVAEHFLVRGVDGVAARDGIVEVDESRYYLLLADGQRLLTPHLPSPLRQKVGARVFLAGPVDRAPVSYGVISPAR